jgi:beta-lactamase superfamily II metal-dependent hydrolase
VLDWIRATGAQVVRTDLAGGVTITFGDDGLLIQTEN